MPHVAGARATDVAHPPRLLDAHGQPMVVYHGSDVADERVVLRPNDKGLIHVSTRASFSRQYGATLQAFHIVAPKLFVWALHGHLLPQALDRKLVVDDELGVNTHAHPALHATLRRLGFMGYRYQQYDFERDRKVTNYALFSAAHLVKASSP